LEGYYVTFEEFVNAADLVLERRRKEKLQQQQQMKVLNERAMAGVKVKVGGEDQFRSNSWKLEDRKSAKLNNSSIESYDALKSGRNKSVFISIEKFRGFYAGGLKRKKLVHFLV
jgi:hypothetical protein